MLMDLTSDLRTAARMIARSPGTSALIVFTLAVAIGAATIGFTFADLALFRGLPVDDNAKVVSIFASDTHGSSFRARVSAPDLLNYRARTTTLEQLSAMREGRAPLIRNGQSQTLTVSYATANVFAAMGQSPLSGRVFREGEDVAGAAPVAVLSHHYWRDEMEGRADAIGRTLQIGREMVTVVGVLSPDIEFGNLAEIDLWLPLKLSPDGPRDVRNLRFIARLREGVSFDRAAAETAAIGDALANEYPLTNSGWKIRLIPIRELTGGQGFWVVIALFLLSIGVLIAIATANVSNLIMVRAAGRARELAVRTAMGARSGRLLRQFLIEGLVLSAIAAALSIPTAWAGLQSIRAVLVRSRVPAIANRSPRDWFCRHPRVDLPGGVFARLGADDREARPAPGAGLARRPRFDRHHERPERAGRRAGGARRDHADRVEPRHQEHPWRVRPAPRHDRRSPVDLRDGIQRRHVSGPAGCPGRRRCHPRCARRGAGRDSRDDGQRAAGAW